MVKQVPATQPSMLGYLVKVDEVWVEDGDVVLGGVADVPELLHQLIDVHLLESREAVALLLTLACPSCRLVTLWRLFFLYHL